VLSSLDLENIDAPIRGIIAGFAGLSYCFTLQSCYGHFIHGTQQQPDSLEPVPVHNVGIIKYRIAYIALCLENNAGGKRLRNALEDILAIDPEYVQFGSPDWFWQRYYNSYALQVEPARFADKDEAIIEHHEALHVQKVRNLFFERLTEIVQSLLHEQRVA
jgi:hypothetical protein